VFDYADDGVELGGHLGGVVDEEAGAVENKIAFVGDVGRAVRVPAPGGSEPEFF